VDWKIVDGDFKAGNVFINKQRIFKIGFNKFFIFIIFLGDYGVSRIIGLTMTMGTGTL
jgi:hypothetical protein